MVRLLLLVLSCSLVGCEPMLVVGERAEATAGSAGSAGSAGAAGTGGTTGTAGTGGTAGTADSAGAAGDGGATGEGGEAGAECPDNGLPVPGQTDPIAVPWSTGFENGFCDYLQSGGFCVGGGTRKTVTSLARSGSAAEFSVSTNDASTNQARCVRQGMLPKEAYYGAWYYVAATATLADNDSSLWNLWHFQGGDASTKGLWDVSLINGTNGNLELLVFDFLTPVVRKQTAAPPTAIPIGTWFHIQFYLKRASDATGAIKLYQDGKLLIEASGIVTDNSTWAQWYVGNIAKELTPADSTLYVDDVTIAATLN